ncbi:hypothetical protein [Nocardioides sp. AX2bis]|uniref:hypothetical protein n=1 Tax=Nocardioides sp. AX2bis TaxID=2653157 RepID=UPI0012F24098|nr:hypothetical protein [Nocardioides sp. AX2bis]VXB81887.1 conserved hypothetical protein [Nocardioides sp. AX2bis]
MSIAPDTLDPVAADEVYVAGIEPHPRPRGRRVLEAALDLWCASFGGLMELSSAGDVVVRRRHDGVEELRLAAGPPQHATGVLQEVRDDLVRLDPEEFRAAWAIT